MSGFLFQRQANLIRCSTFSFALALVRVDLSMILTAVFRLVLRLTTSWQTANPPLNKIEKYFSEPSALGVPVENDA